MTAIKLLSSSANPRFRHWLQLADSPRASREAGRTLAEGLHLAQAAHGAGVPAAAVIVRHGASGVVLDAALVDWHGVERYELAAALYDRLSPVEHGAGIMLELEVGATALPQRLDEDLVYLDGIQDPGNAGALLRTAAAAGVRRIVAAPGTAALWAPKVLRAAMGAHFALRLHEGVAVAALKQAYAGELIAAVAHDAPSLWDAQLPRGALGWVFGAEGSGPAASTLELCARRVRIATDPGVESLNVAAAAAVCLFERRRRQLAPADG